MVNRLKVRRTELGLIQLRVAQKVGMTAPRLSLIENDLAEPTAAEIKALARALETTPDAIFPGVAQSASQESR